MMFLYGIVKGYNNGVYDCVFIDSEFQQVRSAAALQEGVLYEYFCSNGVKPLNFIFDHTGKVVQTIGSFDRFKGEGVHFVLLQVLRSGSERGRLVGYRVMNACTMEIGNVQKEALIAQSEKQSTPLIQNAIIRDNAISAYGGCSFPVGVVKRPEHKKKPVSKPQCSKEAVVGYGSSVPKHSNKPSSGGITGGSANASKNLDEGGSKQSSSKAPDKDLSIEGLTNEQKRILRDARRSGACISKFNNPNLSKDVMKFYGQVLTNDELADACSPIIANDRLNVEQVNELYQCALQGIDYRDMLNENMSAMDMRLERTRRQMEQAGSISHNEKPDEELLWKAIKVSRTL